MDDNKKPPVPMPDFEFEDDVPAATGMTAPDQYNFAFVIDGLEVGKFFWNPEERRLKFEGELDASAKILFELVQMYFLEWERTRGNR